MSYRLKDLHLLPHVSAGWSHLYIERGRIDQEALGIALHDERGKVAVPCAMLSLLMLGPGTSITHAAIRTLADHGCLVMWVGEQGVRFYAAGLGETRSSRNLCRQAACHASPTLRMAVVRRMYQMRFDEQLDPELTLQQIRGMEGVRVRESYAAAAREWGVEWKGRSYRRERWEAADPINRALSVATSCLYGLCHAAIVAAGYSPGLGFIHTGQMLSYVYDIADLYKTEVAIPAAFAATAEGATDDLDGRVRRMCREAYVASRLLDRIVADLAQLLGTRSAEENPDDTQGAAPGHLWEPDSEVAGGINHGGRT